jgi:predicted CXXCH cytochrome family protein
MNIMKRKNFKRKIFSYLVIWSVFIGSLLLYSPNSIAFSATGAPDITISSPSDGSVSDVSTVLFTGSISDETTTPDKLSIKVLENQNNSASPIDITSDGQLTVTNLVDHATFTFSKVFSQGQHTLTFVVTDGDGNSSVLNWTLTVNYAASMNLIKDNNDTSTYMPAVNMTEVPLDYKIRLVLKDDGSTQTSQPVIKVQTNTGTDVPGTTQLVQTNSTDKTFVFTFTPTAKFNPKTTYYVYLNPSSNDLNSVSNLFKFTTLSEDAFQKYKFETDQTDYSDPNNTRQPDYIHGNYSVVTNSCAYCHSVHNGKNEMLEGGKYGDTNNNLCMACHDGTISTAIDIKSSTHQSSDPTKFAQTSSCTSCHNPHANWSVNNPNLVNGN